MPFKPSPPCRMSGCKELQTKRGYCREHLSVYDRDMQQRYTLDRTGLYGTKAWKNLRESQLRKEPYCADCRAAGSMVLATVADHVIPHRGDPQLFFDADNLQSLCKRCHDAKTAGETLNKGGLKMMKAVMVIVLMLVILPSVCGAVLIQGEWSRTAQYQSGDIVSFEDKLYQANGTPLIGACPYYCDGSAWATVEPAITEQLADEQGNYVVTIYGTMIVRSRP